MSSHHSKPYGACPADLKTINFSNFAIFDSKFFGNLNNANSKPQQSTLAFNKPEPSNPNNAENLRTKRVRGLVTSNDSNVIKVEINTDKESRTNADVAELRNTIEKPGQEVDISDESNCGNAHKTIPKDSDETVISYEGLKNITKRTSSKLEDDEDNNDEDEPVRKRSRRGNDSKQDLSIHSKVLKSPHHKLDANKINAESSKSLDTSKITPRTSAERQVIKDQGPVNNFPDAGVTKEVQTSDETPPAEASVEEDASDLEEDEADSEDEKPELAAKAREKVQSTLKSSSKDPYPDWPPGDPVPYAALCTTFSLVEMTTKRLIISAHCSLFLRQVLRLTPLDLLPTIQLMINKLAADYAGIELGIGESLIMKAIGETTGRSLQVIKADQKEIGDLGLVAAKSRSNQPTMYKPKALTVKGVLDGLMGIAIISGDGSQGRKVAGIKKLLSAADTSIAGKGSKIIDITKDKGGASEAKFIIRFLEGKLRLGLAEKTVLVALAHAMVIHETGMMGDKLPSSEQLAKGESILKTVYRYFSLHGKPFFFWKLTFLQRITELRCHHTHHA